MIKQRILTTLGILLSFAIAIGGWALVNALMDMRASNLMSAAGVSPILMPLNIPQAEATNGTESEYPPTPQILTEQNILSILRNQNAPGREMPHEPTQEQITMYDAILIGRRWMLTLDPYINFHPDLQQIHNTTATLSQNIQRGTGDFLPPQYSFWTVTFYGSFMTTVLQINAVEGQVWRAEMALHQGARQHGAYVTFPVVVTEGEVRPTSWLFFETTMDNATDLLDEFVTTIGIDAEDMLYRGPLHENSSIGLVISRPFADGEGHASVAVSGASADGGRLFVYRMSLFLGTDYFMRDEIQIRE